MFSSGAATPGDDDQMRTAESDVVPSSLPFWQVDRYHTLGRMCPAQAKHAPAIANVLAVSFLEFMQCHLRGSGSPATCKTVARRDCAPHTVMRAGRPRTRHARGSIMLHFAIGGCPLRLARPSPLASRFSLLASRLSPLASSPLASRLARLSPLASSPLASSPRHCPRCRSGRSAAAPLHVVVPRATCNVQPSTPLASSPSPLSPPPVRAQRRCALPRCRPTCNVQRATFNPSRLIPFATVPAAGPGATPLRPSTLSSHVQRATFNLQPLSPLASCLRAWRVIVL
jgi:hypothetical protein